SEANRKIQQGAFKIDCEKLSDAKINFAKGTNNVFQVGKRKFAKIIIKCGVVRWISFYQYLLAY
ncbi:hypothetical protein NAI52_10730, partial [Francisella tularensis subsp. holarctica]|nr:hypothetical protein [Francisella tularensis subsp. holarctica]